LKLVIFIHSLSGGGAERVTAILGSYWAAEGWDVTIVTLSSVHDDSYELHPSIKRRSLGLIGQSANALVGLWMNLRRVRAFRDVLRSVKPDVALGMMTGSNVVLALAALNVSSVVAVGSERTYPPQFPLGTIWEQLRRRTYGWLDGVVVQTTKGAEWLRRNSNVRFAEVIPNPVVWPLPASRLGDGNPAPARSKRRLLLAAGRMTEEKQFGVLVEVFAQLESLHPEWDLAIVGTGPLKAQLEVQIASIGLVGRVSLPGQVGNIGAWYESADLFVMTSRFEGFPNVLAEAMAHGLPAVSYDCDTGPRDIIRNGTDGLLVPPGDAARLAQSLSVLMSDDALRKEFSAKALDIRSRLSLQRVALQWERLFEELRK